MITHIFSLIIQQIAETQRWYDKGKKKEASDHAWQSIYLINKLEFDLYPELKERLMPVRLSIEGIERNLNKEPYDFSKVTKKALSELSQFVKSEDHK